MATEKGNGELISDGSFNMQDDSIAQQYSSNSKQSENGHLGKAVAYRAVYGSYSSSRSGTRNARNSDARMLPSRLSKVSVADNNINKCS